MKRSCLSVLPGEGSRPFMSAVGGGHICYREIYISALEMKLVHEWAALYACVAMKNNSMTFNVRAYVSAEAATVVMARTKIRRHLICVVMKAMKCPHRRVMKMYRK